MSLEQQQVKGERSSLLQTAESLTKIPPSTQTEIDAALTALTANKDVWANLDIQERINILDEIMNDVQSVADRWINAGIKAQALQTNQYGIGEKHALFSLVYRIVRLYRQSLRDIQHKGNPRIPGPVYKRSNGQFVAKVFPQTLYDRFSMPGVTAEIWMMPESPLQDGIPAQASFYHNENKVGKVALILGAGNVSALIVADFMHKLFREGQVVVLKPNPVNDYIGPLIEEGFSALIKRGFMRVLYGGVKEGTSLVQHPLVDEIHMTGSDKTFENIVFGPGEAGAERKAARTPQITKPITAELGNISPVIVVPGPWKESDIKTQAAKLGSWLSAVAGCGCLTPRMIINWQQWDQRQKLNTALGDFLSQIQTRKAFYPGTIEIHNQFVAEHPKALQFGETPEGYLPWTLIPDVDDQNKEDICFTQEAFGSLFAETGLEADSVETFIDKAVEFANDDLWGTLVATIIVHPDSMKDPKIAAAVDRAIDQLRYGSVVINQSGVIAYMLTIPSWGAYPGQDIYDVQSGIGTVNNVLMFDHPQKSVVYCPFNQKPDPLLADSRNIHEFGQKLVDFQLSPSILSLTRLSIAALKS